MLVPVSFQWTCRAKSNSHPCLLLCFALCRLWVWFFPYSIFFPLTVKKISLDLLCIYGFGSEGGEDAFLLLLKCHHCVLLCSRLISDVGLFGNHPFCFFYSIWRLSVHWRLIIKCWGVTVCMFNTLWPHVCCSLSFCYVFFFPHLLLVETIQNNPILLMESSPLGALQHQDSFMETSIPVPVLNWQDVSNKSAGCAECV